MVQLHSIHCLLKIIFSLGMLPVLAIPITIFVVVDHDSILNTTSPSVDFNPCHQPLNLGKTSPRLYGNEIKVQLRLFSIIPSLVSSISLIKS